MAWSLRSARNSDGPAWNEIIIQGRKRGKPPVFEWVATCDCGWMDTVLRVRHDALRQLSQHQLSTQCRRDGRAARRKP